MSGLFGSITIKGNRLTDFAGQTATVGIPIPFGEGIFEAPGNVIWNTELKETVKKKKQGKGGVKTEEYTYTCSYAIGFSERNYGYLTITRGGKIVYTNDPNATIEDKAYAAKWLQKATLYYGTKDQMPDSTIEAVKGLGNVTAFRNLAYIVLENDDVTAEGGAIPQYMALCIGSPPEVYMTSPPYPIYFIENLIASSNARKGKTIGQPTDFLFAGSYPLSGTLRATKIDYSIEPDSLYCYSFPLSGEILSPLLNYTVEPDSLDCESYPLSGTLAITKKVYSNYASEKLHCTSYPLSGNLT